MGSSYLHPSRSASPAMSENSRRSSFGEGHEKSEIMDVLNAPKSRKNSTIPDHLVGDERIDQKIVCDWFATSYGEVDKVYHEAYSRQILKQIKEQVNLPTSGKATVTSWFA